MQANSSFRDLLQCLSDARVRYLLVGAHAVAYHSEPRYTKDVDIWSEPTAENAARLWQALAAFGAPLDNARIDDFSNPQLVYQIGVEPNRIDVLMSISGVKFEAAWKRRVRSTFDGVPIHILGRNDLIRVKRAVGRPQDLLDLRRLTSSKAKRSARRKK